MEREGAESNRAQIDDLRDGEFLGKPDGQGEPHKTSLVKTDGTVGLIAAAEIDQQIATAHKYPRSLAKFESDAMTIATKNERVAGDCLFALPRDGKVIEGPSIRLAEIIANCWGNCRVASRTVLEGAETVVAQGIFHDLEKNVAITSETSRRIVDKNGRRYKLDMIVTTSNAAQSIALRNAIVRGVPRAIWWDVYQRARLVAAGNEASLTTKRSRAIESFKIWGVTLEQILALLDKKGEQDIGREELVVLMGVFNSIKDGESTPEDAFPPKPADISTLRTRADEGKKDPAQTVTDASAGDQAAVGEPAVRQAEPTAEQRAAQAAYLAAKAGVAGDALHVSDTAKGTLPPEEEKKPPVVKRTRAAQKELD